MRDVCGDFFFSVFLRASRALARSAGFRGFSNVRLGVEKSPGTGIQVVQYSTGGKQVVL